MPKSSKKRKEKAADFKKVKLKLGKGKKLADNAIDTSFKARFIALPNQSFASSSNNEVSRRGLGLDDLISQIRHYNPSTRKDALLGLKDILTKHPNVLLPNLPNLLPPLARLINDTDANVRKTLLSFFTFIFPQIPRETLIPHVSGILLYVTAAQTHIFPEIRVDGAKFVECLLDFVPEAVIQGWKEKGKCRVLEGYLTMLCTGTGGEERKDGSLVPTSTASVIMSPSSKLTIYQSLSLFLNEALRPQSSSASHGIDIDLWFLAPLFPTPQAFQSFAGLLKRQELSTHSSFVEFEECSGEVDGVFPSCWGDEGVWDMKKILESVEECYSSGNVEHYDTSVRAAQTISRSLYSTLLNAILDHAPNPSTEVEMKTLDSVLNITKVLYGVALKDINTTTTPSTTLKELTTIVKHLTPYFPFQSTYGMEKYEQFYTSLNISFCALSSLIPSSNHIQVRKYISTLLASGGHILSPSVYVGVMPAIWGVILSESEEEGGGQEEDGMLESVIRHSIGVGSKAYLKEVVLEWVGDLILLDTEENSSCPSTFLQKKREQVMVKEWIEHLPKVLWEVGAGNLGVTELILRFLLRFIQRDVSYSHSKTTLVSHFASFFSTTHPTKGVIYGPFRKLDVKGRTRRLALDLVNVLLEGGDQEGVLREGVERCL